MRSSPVFPSARIRSGTHGFAVWDGDVNRRAVADPLTARLRRVRVEDRREEDRAARRVEVEYLRRGRRKAEAVFGGPAADLGAAALADGGVERVDTHLEDDLRIGRDGCP